MKIKGYALSLMFALPLMAPGLIEKANAEISTQGFYSYGMLSAENVRITTQTAVYSMEMTNVAWYQKIALFVIGLDWEEITITTVFSYDSNTGVKKILSVHAWPSDSRSEDGAAFHLDSDPGKKSFLYFLKYTQFKQEEIPKLLALFAFLHNESGTEMKFSAQNLFEKGDGSMHCELLKKKSGVEYIVDVKTLNGSGNQNGKVEVTVDTDPEMFIKKIYAELKIGPKITFTIKDWQSETK